jgi:hypothetical protein
MKHTVETKRKISLGVHNAWKNPEFRKSVVDGHRKSGSYTPSKPRVPKLKREFAIWLSGFFDGEGSVYTYKKGGKDQSAITKAIVIPNTHLEVIRYVANELHVGYTVRPPATNGSKPIGIIRITRVADVSKLLAQILPFLKVKYGRATEVLDLILKDHPELSV